MSDQSDAAARGARQQVNATIMLLSCAAFCSSASIRVLDPALPKLAQEFAMSIPAVAQIVTVFVVVYGSFQLLYGPMADRYGKLRVITVACLIGLFGSMLSGLANNYAMLVLSRILTAAGLAGVIPLAMAWIGDAVPYGERQAMIARFLFGQMVGVAAGSAAAGIAADYFSWRAPFWALALLLVGVIVFLVRKLRSLPDHEPAASQGGLLQQLFDVMRQRWARWILIVVFFEGMALFGPFTYFATHLHLKLGVSLSAAGLLVMLFAAGGLIFSVGSSFMVRHLGEVGLALGGSLLVASGMLLLAYTPVVTFAPLALLLTGLGFYMFHNTLQTNATQMAPQARGSAVALFASCYFLGQSAGVAIASAGIARMADTTRGTTLVLTAGAVAMVLIGGGFAWLRRRV